jgi:hypothetical protein
MGANKADRTADTRGGHTINSRELEDIRLNFDVGIPGVKMATSNHPDIMSILDQLAQCTEALRGCGQDPGMDILALALACRNGLEALKASMPAGLANMRWKDETGNKTNEYSELVEAFTALEVKTGECLKVLEEGLNRIEKEIALLRGKRKAIGAYGRIR